MSAAPSLIAELDNLLQHGSPEKSGAILRQITTLFLQGAPSFNENHVALFDDVLSRLIEDIEIKALAELSRRLAPVSNAPTGVLRRLAKDDDIAVAGPVLSQSSRLDESDLVLIARSKGQAHLFAISSRDRLGEPVTDVLVARGDRDVIHNVAGNAHARLSENGFSNLVRRAESDGELAETVAQRTDIPAHMLSDLVVRATDVVQQRLLAIAKPEVQEEIRNVLARISKEVGASLFTPRDFAKAQRVVEEAQRNGTLDEAALANFALTGRYEETLVALATLCAMPLEVVSRLMNGDRNDPILILCRSSGFVWSTARAIIMARPGQHEKSSVALEQARSNFDRLSRATAQRVVRFWQVGPGQFTP